ncbi:MAG: protease HtpX [Neisseriaceae bacterium]
MRRVFFYLLTNFAVMLMFSIVLLIARMAGVPVEPQSLVRLAIFSLVFGFSGSIFSLWISRWVNLRAVGGQLITNPENQEERWLLETVARLAQQWGFKMPQVAIYPSAEPNAFATGPTRNRALVAVSTGLLDLMSKDEVEGVLGHEIAHIGNGDMVTMTLLQGILNTFVIFLSRILGRVLRDRLDLGVFGYMAVTIVLQIVFGALAMLVLMYYSRQREYRADAGSAKHVGPSKMIAALRKLERGLVAREQELPKEVMALGIKGEKKDSLFSTHPSIENRVLALQGLKG